MTIHRLAVLSISTAILLATTGCYESDRSVVLHDDGSAAVSEHFVVSAGMKNWLQQVSAVVPGVAFAHQQMAGASELKALASQGIEVQRYDHGFTPDGYGWDIEMTLAHFSAFALTGALLPHDLGVVCEPMPYTVVAASPDTYTLTVGLDGQPSPRRGVGPLGASATAISGAQQTRLDGLLVDYASIANEVSLRHAVTVPGEVVAFGPANGVREGNTVRWSHVATDPMGEARWVTFRSQSFPGSVARARGIETAKLRGPKGSFRR